MPTLVWKRPEIGGVSIALATLLVIIVFGYEDWRSFQSARLQVDHTQQVLNLLTEVFSDAKDLETGQRGFVLVGKPSYLIPYETARAVLRGKLTELDQLTEGDGPLHVRAQRIAGLIEQKVAELEKTLEARRAKGFDAALAIVETGEGKAIMDRLRMEVVQFQSEGGGRLRLLEQAEDRHRLRAAGIAAGGSALLFVMLAIAAVLVRVRSDARERALASVAAGKREVEQVRDLLDTTLRSIGDAVITADINGRVTFLNTVARNLTGWDDDGLGRPIENVFRIVNEATRATVESPVDKVRRTGVVAGLANHTVLLARDGREIPIDDSGAPIRDAHGAMVGFVLVFRDISERKAADKALRESEERFRTLVAGTTSLVWQTDAQGAFDTPLPAWEEFTGQTFEDYRGSGGFQAIHAEDRDSVGKAWKEAVEARQTFTMEYRLWHAPSNQYRSVSSRGVPLPGPDGKVLHWIGAITDVTERRELEERVRQSAKLESLGILAGGIAHDFNNLLVGILGSASFLQSLLNDPQQRQIAGQILGAGERAAALTSQMLAYSGRGRFVVEPTDFSVEAEQILPLVRSSIPKHVELVLNLEKAMPAADVDRSQFQQLVMNLVINGAEAIDGPGGRLTVATYAQTLSPEEIAEQFAGEPLQPGSYAVLEVRDTGHGMDARTQARIFDPFFTTKFTGRGLGLAAVLGIVRGHQGVIRVDSTPGSGSTFRILLPASGAPLPAPAPPEAPRVQEFRKATVLVVDDEEIVRRLVQSVLIKHGLDVLTATDGQEAIDIFQAHKDAVTVIVLDLTMPVMSGEEAVPRLRGIRRDVRILASSGYNQTEAMRRFGETIDGFIQKPYTARNLLEAVESALGEAAASNPRRLN